MSTFPECVLLGDIGGTNARLALATDSVLGPITSFEVSRFARFTDVVDLFLREDRHRSRLRHALFSIAAPIHGERCLLTNSPWVIDAIELRATFGHKAITNTRTAGALAELEQKLHGKSKKWSSRSRLTLHDPVSDPEQDFSNFNAQDACSQVPIGNMTQLAATGLRDESAN